MKSFIKTKEEIAILRECGRRLARALDVVLSAVRPGVSTKELDEIAEKEIRSKGDEPAFLHYKPWDAAKPYPATLCVSVNDEIVHGIPKQEHILKEGDIIGLDIGMKHQGLITDMARTVPVGKISKEAQRLLDTTREALEVGIAAAKGGGHVGDIGYDIEKFVKRDGHAKYGIIRELGGHSVGHKVHEEPFIPNFGSKKGVGVKLKPDMVIAIEPMLVLGKPGIYLDQDGFTYRTRDHSLSAHFEHTILITEGKAEILTKI
ncbi:type I methionyl aminopeptidase [bacterium]|nr:type I methionyl aminopeptidase [bacterium]